MTEFNIGDKVVIKDWDRLPAHLQSRAAIGGLCGFEAEIIDKLYSEATHVYTYKLQLTGAKTVPVRAFPAEALDPVKEETAREYIHEITYLDDVVVAIFYEVDEAGNKTEIARGHGHIIHEGAFGVAQATNYALKKFCYKMAEEVEG